VDDVLVKVDRMSMAHGLEVRAPFLDHRIMEMAAALPARWKVNFGRTKFILKNSQRDRLPPAVLSRKKLGFNAPMSHWLLGPLKAFARDRLASRALDNWFDRRELDRLWADHEARKADNGYKLFGLMTLSVWLDQD
jgi:asparagine synthase (glutamine-hydrolysing)